MRYHDIIAEAAAPIRLPTISLSELYHVGTLDPSQKRQGSYEGAGLSVSLHPEEWKEIARGMVSGDTFTLTKPSAKFVPAYKISQRAIKALEVWGAENGWTAPTSLWKVSYYDEEDEARRWFVEVTREKAEFEATEYEDNDVRVTEVKGGGFLATPKMQQRVMSRCDASETPHLLLTIYIEDMTDYDGVWWEEPLSVESLSAPRGVIVPSKVSTWKITKQQMRHHHEIARTD